MHPHSPFHSVRAIVLTTLVVVFACCLQNSLALAGPNAGGVLVVHGTSYWACSLCDLCESAPPDSCGAIETSGFGAEPYFLQVLAAFPEASSPVLSTVSFGILYSDDEIFFWDLGPCGDWEMPTAQWPASGTGNLVGFDTPRTGTIEKIYEFIAYNYYYQERTFELLPNPVLGGFFGDDSVPPEYDTIADFGYFGFDTPGHVICPEDVPTGACCDPDGICTLVNVTVCAAEGGAFLGDGTTCEAGVCDAVGACCLPDATCLWISAADCADGGGEFFASEPSCDPNPCPGPDGACCFAEFAACFIRTESECASGDGVYLGDDESCNPNPCVAACCKLDGTCEVLPPPFCTNGVSLDYQVLCDPDPCPEVGACCFPPFSICEIQTPEDCETDGGTFLGDGVGCEANTCVGACCGVDDSCEILPLDDCEEAIFHGYGTVCDPDPCPESLGPCCFGTQRECEIREPDDCVTAGGEYQGDGLECDVVSACLGACCEPDGCFRHWPEACEDHYGIFLGEGTLCDPNPCPTLGACCFPPEYVCDSRTEEDCSLEGGVYMGDGIRCRDNPCLEPCLAPPVVLVDEEAASRARGERGDGGPNQGGVLLVHADPEVIFSIGTDYCGTSDLTNCETANPDVESRETTLIHVLAAFPEGSSPRVKGVSFGVTFGNCTLIQEWGPCADFESAVTGWPTTPGTGTALLWNEAQTGPLVDVYWFAVRGFLNQPALFELTPHPEQGAFFVDDSVPAVLDPVQGLGSFGFYTPGNAPCPSSDAWACCFAGGECRLESEADCLAEEGTFQGEGIYCSPDPCETSSTGDSSIPTVLRLRRPSPNPSSSSVEVRFELPASGRVQVHVFDVSGALTDVILNESLEAGAHSVTWAPDSRAANGVYYLRLSHLGETRRESVVLSR